MAHTSIAPDYGMPIRGWRAWRTGVTNQLQAPRPGWWGSGLPPLRKRANLLLRSMVWSETYWPRYRAMDGRHVSARAAVSCQGDPDKPTCTCGVYAYKTKQQLLNALQLDLRTWTLNGLDGVVIGTVALWGDVHEHEHGWRGEWAYPDELVYGWGENTDVARIARWYGITYQEDRSCRLASESEQWSSSVYVAPSPSLCPTLSLPMLIGMSSWAYVSSGSYLGQPRTGSLINWAPEWSSRWIDNPIDHPRVAGRIVRPTEIAIHRLWEIDVRLATKYQTPAGVWVGGAPAAMGIDY